MRIFLLTALLLSLVACSYPSEPTFEKVSNINVKKVSVSEIVIEAKAVFNNPNNIGCNLTKTNIDVNVNDVLVGKIDQKTLTEVEANSDFSIPVGFSFPPSKIVKDKLSLLSGVLNSLLDKKIHLQYDGYVTLEFAGISFDVDVDYEEDIDLKKK